MGICVQIQPDGTLLQSAQTIQDCSGHWLNSPQESMWSVVFAQWLTIPDAALIATWFSGPFTAILTIYLVSYCVNLPVSMFNRD